MVISYWSSYWSVYLSITCVNKITLAVMLSWSLYWFLYLLVTCSGRIAGRDTSKNKTKIQKLWALSIFFHTKRTQIILSKSKYMIIIYISVKLCLQIQFEMYCPQSRYTNNFSFKNTRSSTLVKITTAVSNFLTRYRTIAFFKEEKNISGSHYKKKISVSKATCPESVFKTV